VTYWLNNKTGKRYRWLAAATDCTNSRDGLPVVVYCPDNNEHTIYVREQSEFESKFTEIAADHGAAP